MESKKYQTSVLDTDKTYQKQKKQQKPADMYKALLESFFLDSDQLEKVDRILQKGLKIHYTNLGRIQEKKDLIMKTSMNAVTEGDYEQKKSLKLRNQAVKNSRYFLFVQLLPLILEISETIVTESNIFHRDLRRFMLNQLLAPSLNNYLKYIEESTPESWEEISETYKIIDDFANNWNKISEKYEYINDFISKGFDELAKKCKIDSSVTKNCKIFFKELRDNFQTYIMEEASANKVGECSLTKLL